MQVIFETRDSEGALWRDTAVKRLKFVMRRMAWRVPKVKLQLSDVNGPRGGVDKRCQLELQTDGRGTLVVTSVARDWRAAIDAALSRASRMLVRQLQRDRIRQAAVPMSRAGRRDSRLAASDAAGA